MLTADYTKMFLETGRNFAFRQLSFPADTRTGLTFRCGATWPQTGTMVTPEGFYHWFSSIRVALQC